MGGTDPITRVFTRALPLLWALLFCLHGSTCGIRTFDLKSFEKGTAFLIVLQRA